MNLPLDFQKRMKELLKEDYDNYLGSFDQTVGQTFRVNQLKLEPAEFFRRFSIAEDETIPVPWCDTGFYYTGDKRLSLHPAYHAGLYYIQEPSAMAPASFLPVSPGDRVLDLCAAPGGKSTAIGARLSGKGLLLANDISISRCRALKKNIQMAGIANAVVTCEKPEKLAKHFSEYFDKILVDAPCSGEGMFRKDPSMVRAWSASEPARYSRLQKEILSQAASMVKPGGYLLYSTCTYSPEENEEVVETLLTDDAFELVPLPEYAGVDSGHPEWSKSGDPSLVHCRRFWNHRVHGEGQFAALLRKKEESCGGSRAFPAAKGKGIKGKKADLPSECLDFFKRLNINIDETSLQRIEERVFLLPEDAPDLRGLRVVSSGVHLGDCKKKRFEPGHALALALAADQFDHVLRLSEDDERVLRYLRCETIDAADAALDDGWCLICIEGCPLGWGKVWRGRMKNKYPAGWRV